MVWTETQWDRFVERWMAFRQSRRLTQEELASRLGITVKRVRRIEKKREIPDGEVVRRFGRVERETQPDRILRSLPGGDGVI